jgi:hypothetical protein
MAGKFLDKKDKMTPQLCLTQHKRLVPYGTRQNSAFGNFCYLQNVIRINFNNLDDGAKNFIKNFCPVSLSPPPNFVFRFAKYAAKKSFYFDKSI